MSLKRREHRITVEPRPPGLTRREPGRAYPDRFSGDPAGLGNSLGGVPDDHEARERPNQLRVLRMLVEAHDVPDPRHGSREPIWYLRFHGDVMHHALPEERPPIDEALIEEMQLEGVISLEFGGSDGNTWKMTPTPKGRSVIAEEDRSRSAVLTDVSVVVDALKRQTTASNPLAWPAVRPVLEALNDYWRTSGYQAHGVALIPVADAINAEHVAIFAATIRELYAGDYLARGQLTGTVPDDLDRPHKFPAEVALTDKARSLLDGWPGAAPTELVDNLLAVLTAEADAEPDPTRRRRLEALASAVKEVGVSVAAEVISKALTGGML